MSFLADKVILYHFMTALPSQTLQTKHDGSMQKCACTKKNWSYQSQIGSIFIIHHLHMLHQIWKCYPCVEIIGLLCGVIIMRWTTSDLTGWHSVDLVILLVGTVLTLWCYWLAQLTLWPPMPPCISSSSSLSYIMWLWPPPKCPNLAFCSRRAWRNI